MKSLPADGVFQGGGIKGLAIAGALVEFESHARLRVERWVNVAGTSAGAILAAYLAAGHTAVELAALIDRAPFASFQDFGRGGRFLGGAVGFLRRRGLARGEVFRNWFDNELDGMTFADVPAHPDDSGTQPEHRYRLRMIAADVTNHRMLVLPDDLHRYRLPSRPGPIDPDGFKLADAVRMSLSIPYFFQPVELIDLENKKPATIVDGGILSNFPVWLFDTDRRDPRWPTFGLRLVGGRSVGAGLRAFVRMLGWPAALAADISQTQSSSWDDRFVSRSTRVRTCTVDAGDVGTTDFDLPQEKREALVHGGARAARAFLDTYSLDTYRNTYGRALEPAARDD
jgi:NTE family protein